MAEPESDACREVREYIENMPKEKFDSLLADAEALPCTVTCEFMEDGAPVFTVTDDDYEEMPEVPMEEGLDGEFYEPGHDPLKQPEGD